MKLAAVVTTLALQLAAPPQAPAIGDLHFLAGRWTGSFEGAPYEEIHSSPEGGMVLWLSKTYRDGRVVFFEFGTIQAVEGEIVLTPYLRGRRTVSFRLTHVEPGRAATFENPEHDFPTRMRYELVAPDRLRIVQTGPEGADGQTLTIELIREPQ